MENTNFAHEIPSDAVQAASPLETYRLMNTGAGRGFCENHALVYYLFANAAGVKTRLVDLGGKADPLKLTGHFFCEIRDHLDRYWIFTMFEGDVVLGYTFGYGNNRSFSKLRNFLRKKRFSTHRLRCRSYTWSSISFSMDFWGV